MLNVAVLLSGGGSNLRALLEAAAKPGSPIRIVLAASDTEAPGLDHAREFGVPTRVVPANAYADREAWGAALAAELRAHGMGSSDAPWLVVSAGLMRILPAPFVRAFAPRLINTHPALLPAFPGAHAVRDALAAGVSETGVTVHVIDEGVDTGPVIRCCRVPVHPGDTESDLHERIKELERPLLVRTVQEIATGRLDLSAIPH